MQLQPDILRCIGNTSILQLQRVIPRSGARILLKVESENPTGSLKDRMALAMIEAAENDGRLDPARGVVEYTTGSAGASLSTICAVKRYPLQIVTSDAYSKEKLDHMAMMGANLHIIYSDRGRMTEKLTRDMIAAAAEIARHTGAYFCDQLQNTDQLAAYHTLADEILSQTGGKVDAFVQSVGSAACIVGTAEGLRRHRADVSVVAVEPAESPVLSGGASGAHRIHGMGAGYIVPLWRADVANCIEQVSTNDALRMVRRLGRDEGLFVGPSTGANVQAALRVGERLGPDATVVSLLCDSGVKYLSVYAKELPVDPD